MSQGRLHTSHSFKKASPFSKSWLRACVLPMSLFISLTFRFPNREASSEQFSAVLPWQLQKDKSEKITAEDRR